MTGVSTFYRAYEKRTDAVLSVVAGILLWEVAARFWIKNALVIVPPSEIVGAAVSLVQEGVLLRHIATTGGEFLLGFFAGIAVGVIVGIGLGADRLTREIFMPWAIVAFNVPVITLAPLLVIALGLGLASKITIVFIGAVFPTLFNTYAGVTSADERLVEAVQAFGGTRRQVFTKVVLPSALPLMMTGFRLSAGRALVGAIVSELFGARAGIGHMIYAASQEFETAHAFVGIVILGLTGYGIFEGLRAAERRVAPWYAFKV